MPPPLKMASGSLEDIMMGTSGGGGGGGGATISYSRVHVVPLFFLFFSFSVLFIIFLFFNLCYVDKLE
jgi:hypothetical protein